MRTEQDVANEIVERAWRLGCAVIIKPSVYIECDGAKVGGYFDCEPLIPVLTVAKLRLDGMWLGILMHEYCHLTQWVENCDAWRETLKYDDSVLDWVGGKRTKNIQANIKATQAMEADNERRTLRLIQELDAPIDVIDYAKRANAYIHFHNVIANERAWYKEPGALYKPEILEHCNTTIDNDFSKTPRALYKALVEHAI